MQYLNLTKLIYQKRVFFTLVLLCTTGILLYLTYNLYGHSLISDIYNKKSLSFFNKLITNRQDYALKHYLLKSDRILNKIIVIIIALSSITIFYAVTRKLAFFIGAKVNWSAKQSKPQPDNADFEDSMLPNHIVYYFILTLSITILPLFFSKYIPLLDYPWHIARIYIIDNLDTSSILQDWYKIRSFVLPGVGMDLITLPLAKIFPVDVAGRLFIAILFALTISGTLFLYWVLHDRITIWPYWSSLFVFNGIFLFGFLNYLIGIGVFIWAVGIWIFIHNYTPWLKFIIGSILTTVLFFSHLAALGLFAVAVAAYELQKTCETVHISERKADLDLLTGVAIFIIPLVLFISSSTSGSEINLVYSLPWFKQKVVTFFISLISGNYSADLSMVCLFVVLGIIVLIIGKIRIAKSMVFPIVSLFIIYLALPLAGVFSGGYIDTRIPIAIIFIILGSTQISIKRKNWQKMMFYVFFCFIVFRSLLLSYDWHKYDGITEEFTSAFSRLPSGSIMFVASEAPEPDLSKNYQLWQPPLLHLGSLATLHQNVLVPVTWANILKQPIGMTKKYKEIKKFQGNSPPEIRTSEEVSIFINQINKLVLNANISTSSVFLLIIDPKNINEVASEQTEVFEIGSRFKLLKLKIL